jgi:hypothetical protein
MRDPDPGAQTAMAGTPASKADERRRSPRAQCRLHGRIVRGRERVRVRIVDVSDGGLCLLCPVWLDPKKPVQIEIDVPARGLSLARIEIWHIRREKSRVSNNKVWVAGAILVDADGTYAALLEAAGLALLTGAPLSGSPSTGATPPRAPARASTPMPPTPERVTQPAARPGRSTAKPVAEAPLSDSAIDSADPRIFRLRCKANSSPRTRVLSIAAESAEEAMELARRDLGAEWSVLEALEA